MHFQQLFILFSPGHLNSLFLNPGERNALPLIMFLIVQKDMTDRYIQQEVVGRIILLTRGVAVRTDSIMMIDIHQLNSWMTIFLR